MVGSFNRRDFLRLAGSLQLSVLAPRWASNLSAAGENKNILVVVFDALTASHVSLYGYQRETMPNLSRLAERSIVYHNHHASSNFTTSGTSSLLTGTLPWTNRALAPGGHVLQSRVKQNVFDVFGDYYGLAYTHNGWANTLIKQFAQAVEEYTPPDELYLGRQEWSPVGAFAADDDIAGVAWTRYMTLDEGHAYSLFLSDFQDYRRRQLLAPYRRRFPEGLPSGAGERYFVLEDAIDRFSERLPASPQPFVGYLHFLPPHYPYRPPKEFLHRFKQDGLRPVEKPRDAFATAAAPLVRPARIASYDEFLLYVDEAFAALYHSLQSSRLLENTWLVFTSDHGEMFERGIIGHMNPTLYEPLLRVPLLIFEPGRKERLDIYDPTSAVDLLPTLTQLTGHQIPDWAEGNVLPPFAAPDAGRSLYALRATDNDPVAPLTSASTVILKGSHKLHYYFGYSELKSPELVKLFNVEKDPEELEDLSSSEKNTAAALLSELKAKIAETDRPYV